MVLCATAVGSASIALCCLAQDKALAGAPFEPCSVCHSVNGENRTGPTLQGIIGRKSGSVPGFRYSHAMKSAAIIWDEASLNRYLEDPQAVVPGNVMPFSGIADGAQRAAIIAYLKTL